MSDVIPKFVYDRTQADIDERTEKAYVNAEDMNRVEDNIELIAGLFGISVVCKKWIIGDLPRISDFGRIIENIQKIREAYVVKADTPLVPVQPLNTYEKWNDMEHILHDIFWIYIGNVNNYCYCGEVSCGEGIGIL